MLEKLGEALKRTTNRIANALFLDKNLVDSIVRDLQRALIEADVSIPIVKELTDKIKKEAINERIKGIEKKEHLTKVLHDELTAILGESKKLEIKKGQNRIILIGLYGAGKTTTVVKLGNYYAKRGNKVAIISLDTHRPAAQEQLEQLGEKNKINYFVDKKEKDPIKIWEKNEKELKNYNTVIIDTAGRHTLDKELIKEIKNIDKKVKPTESILVIPGDLGQAAKKEAEEFKNNLKISGVIITRMDSTAKGGGALSACKESKAPIYFITNGEKINDIEEFNSSSFLSRLLGMGDLETLIEKVRLVTDKERENEVVERIKEGKLTLEDVIGQVKSMSSIGGFEKIKSMIPGLGSAKIPEEAMQTQEGKISKWEHIIKSMTSLEKENPELLEKETGRIARIAKGAGVNNSDIRGLLKQYKMLKEMMKTKIDENKGLSQKDMQKLMKKFGKVKKIKF